MTISKAEILKKYDSTVTTFLRDPVKRASGVYTSSIPTGVDAKVAYVRELTSNFTRWADALSAQEQVLVSEALYGAYVPVTKRPQALPSINENVFAIGEAA